MQIGDFGIGHSEQSHHITTSFHHHHEGEKTKEASALARSASGVSAGTNASEQGGFSLSAWLADPFKSIKHLFGNVWNGKDAGSAANGANGIGERALSGEEQLLARAAEDLDAKAMGKAGTDSAGTSDGRQMPAPVHAAVPHNGQIAAAATSLQPQRARENPYFLAVAEAESRQPTLLQKVRERAQSAAGHLTKRFSFAGKNPFQAKQERPKEDLRKRSRYHGDDLDIECVLTDDSYLLDSYDRSGQYSQLSAKK